MAIGVWGASGFNTGLAKMAKPEGPAPEVALASKQSSKKRLRDAARRRLINLKVNYCEAATFRRNYRH